MVTWLLCWDRIFWNSLCSCTTDQTSWKLRKTAAHSSVSFYIKAPLSCTTTGSAHCRGGVPLPADSTSLFHSVLKRMALLTNHRHTHTHTPWECKSWKLCATAFHAAQIQFNQSLLNSVTLFQDTQCGKTMICIAHLTVCLFHAAPPIFMENLNQLSWAEGQLCYQAFPAAYFPWVLIPLVFSCLTPGAVDLSRYYWRAAFLLLSV